MIGNDDNPLVSIAMTCYNQENFLEEAIISVLHQKYKNWQLVIVDDCSIDGSVNKVKSIVEKHNISSKVKILVNDKNYGYGYTLGKAISNCDGQLVAVLDADDALDTKHALRICVEVHLKNPSVSMTYTNFNEYKNTFNRISVVWKTQQLPEGKTFLNKGKEIKISHLKMFKKEMYDKTSGIEPSLLKAVDKDLILKLEEIGPLLHIDEFLYKYRSHPSNLTHKAKSKETRKIINKMKRKIFDDAKKRRNIS